MGYKADNTCHVRSNAVHNRDSVSLSLSLFCFFFFVAFYSLISWSLSVAKNHTTHQSWARKERASHAIHRLCDILTAWQELCFPLSLSLFSYIFMLHSIIYALFLLQFCHSFCKKHRDEERKKHIVWVVCFILIQ